MSSLSELEINEWCHFLAHKLNDKLDNCQKTEKLHYPRRSYKYILYTIGYRLRHKMENYQTYHHYAPNHTRLKELRYLIPMEIDEDIIYDRHRILKRGCTEENPQQRHIYKRKQPKYENSKPVIRYSFQNWLACFMDSKTCPMHRTPENELPRSSMP